MDVICLGLMVCDVMAKPVPHHVMDKDISIAGNISMANGGDAMNVAVNLAAMGVCTGLIGRVGMDVFGEFLLGTAAKSGIDTSGVVRGSAGTATCLNLIRQDGNRSFVFCGGAGDSLCQEDVDFARLDGAKALVVGGAGLLPGLDGEGLANVMKRARELGLMTCMDLSGDLAADPSLHSKILLALKHTDIFLPSDYQAAMLTGCDQPEAMAAAMLALGPRNVAIKMGHRGCVVADHATMEHIPAFAVDVVDTTGSGDAFVAGFLTAKLHGYGLADCGRLGNAAGALCATSLGATAWARPFQEVRKFLATGIVRNE